MSLLLVGNALAYFIQIAIVVAVCAGLPRLVRLHAPGVQYLFWRSLLFLALALPLVEPWLYMQPTTAILVVNRASAGAAQSIPPAAPSSHFIDPRVLWIAAAGIAAGAFVRVGLLIVGLVRLHRLRTCAIDHDCSAAFADLQERIGTHATICWSTEVPHPVTFGWRRPVVLLPPAVASLDTSAAHALVAHELFHVRRGDWWWQVAEEMVRAVYWFHPAMWWLISRVQLARETVVDELSILATNSRRAYMDTLLAFADDRGPLPASAFSRRRHLFHRIMLLSREGSMSATRVTFASLVLAVALTGSATAAVAAFPLLQPPRDPVPGRLSPEQRATLDRAVDQARAAVAREPNAPDLLNDLGAAAWNRATRDPDLDTTQKQQLLREGIAAESSALAVRPDYVPALVYKNLLLRVLALSSADPTERRTLLTEADTLRDRAMALQKTGSGVMPPPPPPPPPPSGAFDELVADAKAVRVGSGLRPPTKIRDVRPVYPPDAQAARVQGVVIVEALVDRTGHVANARVLRSIPLLDEAALEAVRQWEYEPVLLNGAPVSVVLTLTVNFSLK